MSDMPKEIEMDAKYTVKGYLQVDQWSAKGGLRPPPINGNTREKYIRADLVEELIEALEEVCDLAPYEYPIYYHFEKARQAIQKVRGEDDAAS